MLIMLFLPAEPVVWVSLGGELESRNMPVFSPMPLPFTSRTSAILHVQMVSTNKLSTMLLYPIDLNALRELVDRFLFDDTSLTMDGRKRFLPRLDRNKPISFVAVDKAGLFVRTNEPGELTGYRHFGGSGYQSVLEITATDMEFGSLIDSNGKLLW